MRYTIEATENSCTAIFELRNGKKYIRKHSRTQYGSICNDAMFDDQLEADSVDPDTGVFYHNFLHLNNHHSTDFFIILSGSILIFKGSRRLSTVH